MRELSPVKLDRTRRSLAVTCRVESPTVGCLAPSRNASGTTGGYDDERASRFIPSSLQASLRATAVVIASLDFAHRKDIPRPHYVAARVYILRGARQYRVLSAGVIATRAMS